MNRILSVVAVALLCQACGDLDSPTGANPAGSVDQSSNMQTPDLSPPDLILNRTPPAISADRAATFEFSSTDPTAKFECSLDGQEFTLCSSPKSYANLAEGNHQMRVKARDPAGNQSNLGVHSWMVHTQAFTVTISTSIPAFTNQRNFSIAFTRNFTNIPIAGFECKLGALDYAPCTSPYNLSNLPDGDKAVQIRIKDSNGGYSAPAALQWRVDTVVPLISIPSGPEGVIQSYVYSNIPAVFQLQIQDAGSQLRSATCRLDTAGFGAGQPAPCSTSAVYNVSAEQDYILVITAVDNAGNTVTVTRNFRYQWVDPGGGGDGGGGPP